MEFRLILFGSIQFTLCGEQKLFESDDHQQGAYTLVENTSLYKHTN